MSKEKEIQEVFNVLDNLGVNYNKTELIENNLTEQKIKEFKEALIFIMSSNKTEHKLMSAVLKSGEFIPLFVEK